MMKTTCIAFGLVLCVSWCGSQAPAAIVTLDYPQAHNTVAHGIDGARIVGSYAYDAGGNWYGFTYEAGLYSTLEYPGATNTRPYAVSGDSVVGWYDTGGAASGFLYDYNSGTWTSLAYPGATRTYVYGIDGARIVGECRLAGTDYGFIYDGTTWTTLEAPNSTYTRATGIDGDRIVGSYYPLGGALLNGFSYDGTDWTTFAIPGNATWPYDVDDDMIVGVAWHSATDGFLYDGTAFSLFSVPGGVNTTIYGIDGTRIVGSYYDVELEKLRGFYTDIPPIPAPGAVVLGLLGMATAGWLKRRRAL